MSNILPAPWQCRCKSADQMSELMAALDKAGYERLFLESFNEEPYIFTVIKQGNIYTTSSYEIDDIATYDPNQIIDALQNT